MTHQLKTLVLNVLDDMKATNVVSLNIQQLSPLTDIMIIATGNSTRHVKAIAHAIIEKIKEHNIQPMGIEGEAWGEWILLDLNDVLVHVMLADVRGFYNLEKLWSFSGEVTEAAAG